MSVERTPPPFESDGKRPEIGISFQLSATRLIVRRTSDLTPNLHPEGIEE